MDLSNDQSKLDEIIHNERQFILPSKPKLRTYSLFQKEIKAEAYATLYLPKHERSVFWQFPLLVYYHFKLNEEDIVGKILNERVCQ